MILFVQREKNCFPLWYPGGWATTIFPMLNLAYLGHGGAQQCDAKMMYTL